MATDLLRGGVRDTAVDFSAWLGRSRGAGADRFHFSRLDGQNTIQDFNTAKDQIVLDYGLTVSSKVKDAGNDGVNDRVLNPMRCIAR